METIANVALYETEKLVIDKDIQSILKRGLSDDDDAIVREAVRTNASLLSLELRGAKYPSGVFLLYPTPSQMSQQLAPRLDVDIIFVHGVTGCPKGTWRWGPEMSDSTKQGCWASDWLPVDFPSSRIISIGYEIFLSSWFGTGIPLIHQSKIVIDKLKLASVGDRPIIFITHSFGGLLVKEMLRYASRDKRYKKILDSTIGVVFYSTPHFGSDLTHYRKGYADSIFRGNSVVDDLTPSQSLIDLNTQFPEFASHVATLSIGEGVSCFGTRFSCIQIVPDESANPGWQPLSQHRFTKFDTDHRSVCKPETKTDPRYTVVVDWMHELMKDKSKE
eukprot:TRINITY_DN4230_c0_g1_i1.p1 TRINITY_DN4230_c0_g1~~TRINITY_DN4230_c0_g1_i1.p1  ORF type:complete len:390 (+),score=43.12 TRINITY_DN4230_c0_g1_i1:176-1171(+)